MAKSREICSLTPWTICEPGASGGKADGRFNDAPMRCAGRRPLIVPCDRRHVLDAEAAHREADNGRAAKRCKALTWQLLAEIGYLDNLLAKTRLANVSAH